MALFEIAGKGKHGRAEEGVSCTLTELEADSETSASVVVRALIIETILN